MNTLALCEPYSGLVLVIGKTFSPFLREPPQARSLESKAMNGACQKKCAGLANLNIEIVSFHTLVVQTDIAKMIALFVIRYLMRRSLTHTSPRRQQNFQIPHHAAFRFSAIQNVKRLASIPRRKKPRSCRPA